MRYKAALLISENLGGWAAGSHVIQQEIRRGLAGPDDPTSSRKVLPAPGAALASTARSFGMPTAGGKIPVRLRGRQWLG